MENKTNENLFREIGKLRRTMRQIMPPPHGPEGRIPRERRPHPPMDKAPMPHPPHPPRREHVLRLLLAEETGLRQKHISDMIGIGAPAMSETIDRLEEDHYIERIADPEDRRATRIVLTDKGRARASEIQDNHAEHLNKLFGNLTEEEKLQLIRLLQKITQ